MRPTIRWWLGFASTLALLAAPAAAGEPLRVHVGTYTDGDSGSKGIYRLTLDPDTGKLSEPELVAETVSPSFLAWHPNGKYLYAVNELDSGTVTAFAVDPDSGKLTTLNHQATRGSAPCHLSVDPTGRFLLVANYGSGNLVVLRIDPEGRLGEFVQAFQPKGSGANPRRQDGPHAHCVRFDPSGLYAVEADLGLDRVHVFRFDPGNTTEPLRLVAELKAASPGAGPRHLAFHPSGRYFFVNNEMNSTVTSYHFYPVGPKELFTPIETLSTLPEGGHERNSTAETVVHPNGRFLYVSNRGHDSLASFRIDVDPDHETVKLTPIGHQSTGGKTPRNFNIDPSGRFLLAANQGSDTIVAFRVDPETGKLEPTGSSVNVPKPVCILFDRAAEN
jgi:6-phosphogluconolactonase